MEVNNKSIEKVDEILDEMIGKKELFSKLTKRVHVRNYVEEIKEISDCDFTKKFSKLFSKPLDQSHQNVKFITLSNNNEDLNEETKIILQKSLTQIPIGFMVKDLTIDLKISKIEIYEILTNFGNLERICINMAILKDYQENKFTIQVPCLEKLKFLIFEAVSYCWNDLFCDILKLCPNLEYLIFKNCQANEDFFKQIARHCPKLKGISCENRYFFFNFTDEAVYQFLKGVPHLEYLNLKRCSNINGEIFSKIGEFINLRFINIEHTDGAHQIPVLKFGGGILDKLEYFRYGIFSMKNATELEKENFINSFLEMAPNIKDIGSLSLTEGIQILDYVDQFCPLLTTFPKLRKISRDQEKIEKWLNTSKIIQTVHWNCLNLPDLSNIEPIPTVKSLSIDFTYSLSEKYSKELGRIFPSLTKIHSHLNFFDRLNEGQWPDLEYIHPINQEIISIRPLLCGYDTNYEIVESTDEIIEFVRKWIVLLEKVKVLSLNKSTHDQLVQSKIFWNNLINNYSKPFRSSKLSSNNDDDELNVHSIKKQFYELINVKQRQTEELEETNIQFEYMLLDLEKVKQEMIHDIEYTLKTGGVINDMKLRVESLQKEAESIKIKKKEIEEKLKKMEID